VARAARWGPDVSDAQFVFNYRYFVGHAAAYGGRVLDYGCGIAQTVTLGRARGLDIWGADTLQATMLDGPIP
jgi:hypothetical protein